MPTGLNARTCFFVNKAHARNYNVDLLRPRLGLRGAPTKHQRGHYTYTQRVPAEQQQEPRGLLHKLDGAIRGGGKPPRMRRLNAHHPLWGDHCAHQDRTADMILELIDRYRLGQLLPRGAITWEDGESATTIDLSMAPTWLEG